MAHEVFISYASQDKAVGDAVCAALEDNNVRCWIAPRDIRFGEQWAGAINNAIKSSKIMVLIFSKNSNQSKQVANELTLAVNSSITVIPFKIDNIYPSGLFEYYLAGTHWLDALNYPSKKQISNLVETVKHNLEPAEEDIKPSLSGLESNKAIQIATAKSDLKAKKEKVVLKRKKPLLYYMVGAAVLVVFAGIGHFIFQPQDPQFLDLYAHIPDEHLLIITSAEDSGEGTLRQAIKNAVPGDVIVFDPGVFLPKDPATIYLKTNLPVLKNGKITIDGSNAGVIINGMNAEEDYIHGIKIESSGNTIMGLQIVNCRSLREDRQGAGILLAGSNNIIGGDRSIGAGPIGQGNLVAGNCIGIDLPGGGSSYNHLLGNLIGTADCGRRPNIYGGNNDGIVIDGGSNNHIIGPDNIIAHNYSRGIVIGFWDMDDSATRGNTITSNSIFSNYDSGIILGVGANRGLAAPLVESVNLEEGSVLGITGPNYTVEIYSDYEQQGQIFEGAVEADKEGRFIFNAGQALEGPYITATATDGQGNTSDFSDPVKGDK